MLKFVFLALAALVGVYSYGFYYFTQAAKLPLQAAHFARFDHVSFIQLGVPTICALVDAQNEVQRNSIDRLDRTRAVLGKPGETVAAMDVADCPDETSLILRVLSAEDATTVTEDVAAMLKKYQLLETDPADVNAGLTGSALALPRPGRRILAYIWARDYQAADGATRQNLLDAVLVQEFFQIVTFGSDLTILPPRVPRSILEELVFPGSERFFIKDAATGGFVVDPTRRADYLTAHFEHNPPNLCLVDVAAWQILAADAHPEDGMSPLQPRDHLRFLRASLTYARLMGAGLIRKPC